MKKLIVHIEYEGDEIGEHRLKEALDNALTPLRERGFDLGWRYFQSLDGAIEWEMGESDIQTALRLVGHLRRMIGKMADEGMNLPH